ncbi:MAG: porin family protein [Bacteroidota bacterium]
MKKLFFTVVASFLALGLSAQGLSVGIKAGVNFAGQTYSSSGFTVSPDGRTGFHAGGYVNLALSEKLSVQPELLYNSVGAKVGSDDIKFDYVSIPVVVKFNPTQIFNIHLGPQFGFLMSAKSGDLDVKDQTKGMDLGLASGVGVDLPMGLNFAARFILGLSNIDDSGSSSDVKVKNQVFQVSVGYRLIGAGDK